MPFAHLLDTPLMRRVEHLGPWTGVTRPASDAAPEVVAAAQAARARRRRPGAPRTHRRTRIARGELPAPKAPLPHERDALSRTARADPRLPPGALRVLMALLQLEGMAAREGEEDVATFVASVASMAMLFPRRTRDLLRLLEAEGYISTRRLPGRTFRHRRLRVVVLDKARAKLTPKRGPRPKPREVELTYRLLNSQDPKAADVLAGFYRRGRWGEGAVTCNSLPASTCLRQKRDRPG
jgi:DNA-binding MarR family transcriptional regulator